jgi:hypothetical protein
LSKKQDIPQSPSYHAAITKFFQTTEDESPAKIENAQQVSKYVLVKFGDSCTVYSDIIFVYIHRKLML